MTLKPSLFQLWSDLLPTATFSTAQLSQCSHLGGEEHSGAADELPDTFACTSHRSFIYLEAFLSITYNINRFIFSSSCYSQQWQKNIVRECWRPPSALRVYFDVCFPSSLASPVENISCTQLWCCNWYRKHANTELQSEMPINLRALHGRDETQLLVSFSNTGSHSVSHHMSAELERETEKWSTNETEKDEISKLPLCRKQISTWDKQGGGCYGIRKPHQWRVKMFFRSQGLSCGK